MLEEQNQIAYMSHNHPEAISFVRRFGEISSRSHFNLVCDEPYQIEDTNVWGHLSPDHLQRQRMLWQIMREEEVKVTNRYSIDEQEPRHYDRMMFRLRQALSEHLDQNMSLNPYIMHNKSQENQLALTGS